jgi:hypothetical protein
MLAKLKLPNKFMLTLMDCFHWYSAHICDWSTYSSWIYNYLCNWYLSPLMRVRILLRTRCTTLYDKVCQCLALSLWYYWFPVKSAPGQIVLSQIGLRSNRPQSNRPQSNRPQSNRHQVKSSSVKSASVKSAPGQIVLSQIGPSQIGSKSNRPHISNWIKKKMH